jgi:hypothetical protein
MALENKKFVLKVYNPTTGELKKSYSDKFFASGLDFSIEINGGLTELQLMTSQELREYTQSDGQFYQVPQAGDLCKFFIYDKENPNGVAVYSGVYRGTDIAMNGKDWTFLTKFLPNTLKLARRILRNGSDTTVSYSSDDPADIVRDIVDQADTDVSYDNNSVRDVGIERSYTFKVEYALEALKKIIGIMPAGWFFYVGADDKVYLRNSRQGQPNFTLWNQFRWGQAYWKFDPDTDSTTIHELYTGSEISALQASNDLGEIVNRVVFIGGDTGGGQNLFKEYESSNSQDQFGLYEKIVTDQRVTTETTAELKSKAILNSNSAFRNQVQVEVIDSNITDGKGYDIESLKVGDIVRLRSQENDATYTRWNQFRWGQAYWRTEPFALFGIDYIIQKINYKFDRAVLVLDFEPTSTVQRVEDVNKDLTQLQANTVPDQPT